MRREVEVWVSELAASVEQAAAGGEAAVVCWLPAAPDGRLACPLCGRMGTLTPVGEVLYCAACGYASDGVAGCT
jgi:hypothetical protein